ncbi:hypothetical protein VPHF89G1_0038 [Vibrio phage F89 g1]
MTISKITPYTGGVANPDGSQTQTEFTQNMFDQLSYEANLSTELNNTIDGMNDTAVQVDADAVSASQSAAAAEAAVSGLDYQGLWPNSGGSANKGETWQTQTGGTPTGQYFTALQNTTVDPVGDNVNWRRADYGRIYGQGNRNYTVIAGVIRRSTAADSWDWINDSTHRPSGANVGTMSIDGSNPYKLNIPYNFTAIFNGAVVIGSDESFSQRQILCGATVTPTELGIRCGAPFECRANMSNGNVANLPNYFDGEILITDGVDGSIKNVQHPPANQDSDSGLTVNMSNYFSDRAFAHSFALRTIDNQNTEVTYLSEISGFVTSDGSNITVQTNNTVASAVWDSGSILVSHSNLGDEYALPTVSGWYGNGYVPYISSFNESIFRIKFRDLSTGTDLGSGAPPDATMAISYGRPSLVKSDWPANIICRLSMDYANIKWGNLYSASGNFWILGFEEI